MRYEFAWADSYIFLNVASIMDWDRSIVSLVRYRRKIGVIVAAWNRFSIVYDYDKWNMPEAK